MSHICDAGRYERDVNGLGGKDLALILVMTGSTAATELSKDQVADYTSLLEYDGDGYDRIKVLAADWTLTRNNTLHRDELVFDNPVTYAAVDAASLTGIGLLVAIIIGADEDDDADNIPLAYINSSSAFPRNGDGGDLVFTSAALGVLRFGG